MPIRVTCSSCHTRFNVSDKFAGKEGPCPKCKKVIRVPDKNEEVVIHAPETSGPKDSKGRSVLNPIRRQETSLSSVQITLLAVCIVGFLLAALVLRMMHSDEGSKFPEWILSVAAVVIAAPICYVGYAMLRDSELAAFSKTDLRNRVIICSLIYAATWLAMPLAKMAMVNYELSTWIMALVAMLGIGGTAGMYSFDFDYLYGAVHYGMYLVICLVGRGLAGIGFMPGMYDAPAATTRTRTTTECLPDVLPILDSGWEWLLALVC